MLSGTFAGDPRGLAAERPLGASEREGRGRGGGGGLTGDLGGAGGGQERIERLPQVSGNH